MKKILSIAFIALSFMSCKSKTNDVATTKDIIILGDSSKLIPGSTLTDTALLVTTNPDGTTTTKAVVPGEKPEPVAVKPVVKPKATSQGTASGGGTTATRNSTSNSTAGTTAPAERRGISKAAKGAIIGGVGGAAAGAIIGRNAKGAAIGAGVGAAGGYIIGRSKDKRDGRN